MQNKNGISLDSTVKYELNAIAKSLDYTAFYDLNVTIHTPKANLPILYPIRFDRLKDYIDHFSDVLNLTIAVPGGDYAHLIFPNKDKLEITLEFVPLKSTTEYIRHLNGPSTKKRYIAKLTEVESDLAEGNNELQQNYQKANQHVIKHITFQLVDKTVMALRSKTFGTIVRNTTGMDVIRYCLTELSRNLSSGDSENIKGVNVVKGHSEEVRQHIIIPHLTKLVSVPKVVNEAVGGLYPTGFSYYLRGQYWYVYPLYDNTRFESSDMTLTIINLPANRLPGIEKTFRITATQLIVLSTGNVKFIDTSIAEKDSVGDVVRFVDSRQVIEGYGKRDGNKFIADYSGNITEAAIGGEVEDPNRATIQSSTTITAAYNNEFSKLASRNGTRALITWENSNDAALYPGMPVRYIFTSSGELRQLYGTLHQSDTVMTVVDNNVKQRKFKSITVLTCFLSNDVNNRKVK